MKKIWIFSLMMSAVVLLAAPVDSSRAYRVAQMFWKQLGSESVAQLVDISGSTGYTTFYIYSAGNGFVIVSGNDAVQPILAYSKSNPFSITDASPALREWLDSYDMQLQEVEKMGLEPSDQVADAWHRLANGMGSRPTKGAVVIEPLLTTQWSQDADYNKLCPWDESERKHCPVGCVATAMAQIMAYWAYPEHGTGSYCYRSNYGMECADFENTYYNWAIMPSQLSSASSDEAVHAVALLNYHCGVSVDMGYGPSGSGAFITSTSTTPSYVFPRHFGYPANYQDQVLLISRNSYSSDDDWYWRLIPELQAGRPLFYSGGVHAFVCDGVDSNSMFHFNWGWGGVCDGYYAMGHLTPGAGGTGAGNGDFSNGNLALVGLEPPFGLRVLHSQFEFGMSGGSASTYVYPSHGGLDWTVKTTADWIHVTPSVSDIHVGRVPITISVDTCFDGVSRDAILTISQGDEERTIRIWQRSCDVITQFPLVEDFSGYATECWQWSASDTVFDKNFGIHDANLENSYIYRGNRSFWFTSRGSGHECTQYLVSPELQLDNPMQVSFQYCRRGSVETHFDVYYSVTDNDVSSFVYKIGEGTTTKQGWSSFKGYLPSEAKYVMISAPASTASTTLFGLVIDHVVIEEDTMRCADYSHFPVSENFEQGRTCWTYRSNNEKNWDSLGIVSSSVANSGNFVFQFSSQTSLGGSALDSSYWQYLVSPQLNLNGAVTLSFNYALGGKQIERFKVLYSTTGNENSDFVYELTNVEITRSKWKLCELQLPPQARYVAIVYQSVKKEKLLIDDISIAYNQSIDDIRDVVSFKAYVSGRTLTIHDAQCPVSVYDVKGCLIASLPTTTSYCRFVLPTAGLYMVKSGTQVTKVVAY
ncbi:MAG: C10 family peptidase [Bacteroidales bacterium]|nr:C10 family peptidase [Candidatus Colimorpha onthohippi]